MAAILRNTDTTSWAPSRARTWIGRHLRVDTSTTVRARNRHPSWSSSATRSMGHATLGATALIRGGCRHAADACRRGRPGHSCSPSRQYSPEVHRIRQANQPTGASRTDGVLRLQVAYRSAPLRHAQRFSGAISCSITLSRLRSATTFFGLAFSTCSDSSSRAWLGPSVPHCSSQRQNVAPRSPACA